MTQQADNLQLVADLAVAAQNNIPTTASTLMLVPDGMTLENLERYQYNRDRLRGKFCTTSLASLIEHAQQQAAEYTEASDETYAATVFIQPENMRAQAIYNLGSLAYPGHADHTAALTLQPTPALKALQHLTSAKHHQQALAEWIEDWAALITDIDGASGQKMGHSQALASIRSMTIKSASELQSNVENLSASASRMDQIEASGKGDTPATLHLTLTPYPDLDDIEVVVRLSVLTSDDKPMLRCRWVGQQQQEEAIANNLRDKLQDALGDTATIYLGSYMA